MRERSEPRSSEAIRGYPFRPIGHGVPSPAGDLSAGSPAGPAAPVPVATKVGCVHRHDDDVSQPGRNVPVASRTDVGLGGLVGLDEPFLQIAEDLGILHVRPPCRVRGGSTWSPVDSAAFRARSQEQRPGHEHDGDGYGSAHVYEVAWSARPGALRIETHGLSIVPGTMRPHPLLAIAVLLVATACAGSPPAVPGADSGTADPILVEGRGVWARSCASCHAPDGSGGRGPSLRAVVQRFPDSRDQVEVVADGRRGMPAFGGRYSDAEILAVVRYTREVLGTAFQPAGS